MRIEFAARCALALLAAACGGCATIVARSNQTMTVTSVPPASNVSITNKSGVAVHSGITPMTVTLKKGRGYFKPETYTVKFTREGFAAKEIIVRGEVNGWYFGNVIFGGLIGLLAVDPATGAMYTLRPKGVDATLDALGVSRDGDKQTLTVVLVANVPGDQKDQLVPLQAN